MLYYTPELNEELQAEAKAPLILRRLKTMCSVMADTGEEGYSERGSALKIRRVVA